MKYAIYRHNPYWSGGAYRPVLRNGKLVTFPTKAAGEAWLAKANLTARDPNTTFGVRKMIKPVRGGRISGGAWIREGSQ